MPADPEPRRLFARAALASATLLLSVNVWTGAPLFAIWVGSRAQQNTQLEMGTVLLVLVVLAVVETVLVLGLTWAAAAYDRVIGRPAPIRRTYPWNTSLSAEREQFVQQRQGVSAIERVVAVSVVAGVIAFEIWFFFFAGSSLPNA